MNVQSMLACRTCGKPTLHLVRKPNHVLHVLLSMFTLGAWLLVWAMLAFREPRAVCTVCGTRYRRALFERV